MPGEKSGRLHRARRNLFPNGRHGESGARRVTMVLSRIWRQEAFLRVFRGLPRFDGRAKLSTWIYTIAHRVAIDHLRQAGCRPEGHPRRRQRSTYRLRTTRCVGARPGDGCGAGGTRSPSSPGAGAASGEYRLPLLYAALDDLDYGTIGAMLGVPPGTVKTLVFRGKRLLKERVEAALVPPAGRGGTRAT